MVYVHTNSSGARALSKSFWITLCIHSMFIFVIYIYKGFLHLLIARLRAAGTTTTPTML